MMPICHIVMGGLLRLHDWCVDSVVHIIYACNMELFKKNSDFGAARSVPPVFSCDFVCFAASLFAF